MSPEFRAGETPWTPAPIRCACGTMMADVDGDLTVWHIDGDEVNLDTAIGDGLGEGDLFCSADCAHEARCSEREARDFEERAYGHDGDDFGADVRSANDAGEWW